MADDNAREASRKPPRRRFPKALRLTLKREFDAVRTNGRSVRDGVLRLGYRYRGDSDPARLGLAVSRRLGGAVHRNRLKRVARAAFRELLPVAPTGYDLVLIPLDPQKAARLPDAARSLSQLLARLAEQAP